MSSAVGQSQPKLIPFNVNDGSVISSYSFIKMLVCTFLMVTVPISSYFVSKKFLFEDYFLLSEDASMVPSVLTAVVMIHVVLALFIYAAYTSDVSQKRKQT